jgi:hypothetical protein
MTNTSPDNEGEARTHQDVVPKEELVEAGHVRPLEDVPFHHVKHRAETARWLAIVLVGILGVSFFLHYGLTAYFAANGKAGAVESLSRAFNVWLPVVSSLAGGATAYYFTREKDK